MLYIINHIDYRAARFRCFNTPWKGCWNVGTRARYMKCGAAVSLSALADNCNFSSTRLLQRAARYNGNVSRRSRDTFPLYRIGMIDAAAGSIRRPMRSIELSYQDICRKNFITKYLNTFLIQFYIFLKIILSKKT